MSADWYFMKKCMFFHNRTVGPICETDLLKRIAHGEVRPETMISSTSKTHGHWLRMKEVRPAIKHYLETHPRAAS